MDFIELPEHGELLSMDGFNRVCDIAKKEFARQKDIINHPDHYTKGIETIDYIESWEMDYKQGNVIKYVTRYKYKNGLEDLKKAQWYLNRLIKEMEEK